MRLRVFVIVAFLAACGRDKVEVCDDGKDNDLNGFADCADAACGAGARCGPNGLVCGGGTCATCSGNGGRAEASETSCGDDFDNDCDGLVDCADPDCQASGTAAGATCDAEGHTCGTPDAGGVAFCDRCANGQPADGGCTGGTTGGPALGYVRFAEAEYGVLGAMGSGYREKSTLTFEVLGEDGKPYGAGLRVRFTHESQGGSYLGTKPSCTATSPSVCSAEGLTDETGRARVVLTSGRRFAVVSVRAEATLGTVVRSATAEGLAIVGAKANGAHLSLDCKPYNVPALTVHDCLYSNYDVNEPVCTVSLADRHGIVLGVPTAVTFQSEAANAPAPVLTPAFELGSADAALGYAKTPLHVYGYPLPRDVDPWPGEASRSVSWLCGNKTGNPRDGFVSVIAMVTGEEGFVDQNLNGRFDAGEPFVDLGEPYVDANDNGKWDAGEWYLDANDDGSYTGPNGKWDENTVLWTQTRIVYTGHPSPFTTQFYDLGSGEPPGGTALQPFYVNVGPPPTSASRGIFVSDDNLNPMSSFTSFAVAPRIGNVAASLFGPDHTADTPSTLGGFRLLYCDKQTPPATCRSGVVEEACRTSPCYVVPDVGRCSGGSCSGFLYGNYGVVTITGKQVGPDVVDLAVTVDNVTSLFPLDGQCVP